MQKFIRELVMKNLFTIFTFAVLASSGVLLAEENGAMMANEEVANTELAQSQASSGASGGAAGGGAAAGAAAGAGTAGIAAGAAVAAGVAAAVSQANATQAVVHTHSH
jgi:hypothetical protein